MVRNSTKTRKSLMGMEDEEDYEEYDRNVEISDRYPRDGENKCIYPCTRFTCMFTKEICDANCNKTLENPCLICENKCSAKLKKVSLRPDVINYQKYVKGENLECVFIEEVAEDRKKLMDLKYQIDRELAKYLDHAKKSILPGKLALARYRSQINELKAKRLEVEHHLDRQLITFGIKK